MKKLSYETLHEMNYDGYLLEDAPERVLQFGEGNFLRAFTDDFIDVMNEKAGLHFIFKRISRWTESKQQAYPFLCQPMHQPL